MMIIFIQGESKSKKEPFKEGCVESLTLKGANGEMIALRWKHIRSSMSESGLWQAVAEEVSLHSPSYHVLATPSATKNAMRQMEVEEIVLFHGEGDNLSFGDGASADTRDFVFNTILLVYDNEPFMFFRRDLLKAQNLNESEPYTPVLDGDVVAKAHEVLRNQCTLEQFGDIFARECLTSGESLAKVHRRILSAYVDASPQTRQGIEEVILNLSGWELNTLLDRTLAEIDRLCEEWEVVH